MRKKAIWASALIAAIVGTVAVPAASASATTPYDAVTASSMNNLAQAMEFYDLVNGSYRGVNTSDLSSYGFNNGASTSTQIWTENNGQDFLAVGQDVHASSVAYVYSTTSGVMGAGANSVTQTTLSVPGITAGVRIASLSDLFDWAAMGTTYTAISAQSVCDETLFSPAQTHLNGSSLPDAYVACMAGAGTAGATGATAIQAIALAGGVGVLAWLSLMNTTPQGVSIPGWVTPAGPQSGAAAEPLPAKPEDWPDYANKAKLSAKVASVNALSTTIADAVTDTCEYNVAAAALAGGPDECSSLPIFASGQYDVSAATNHDIAALITTPEWVKLNYRAPALNPSYPGWYNAAPVNCNGSTSMNCDEFPFYSTLQGGGQAAPLPSVQLIPATPNQAQGTLLNSFYTACHVKTTGDGSFLNVPIPPALSSVPTIAICNGN